MSPCAHVLEHLVPTRWCCFEKLWMPWRRSFDGWSRSLGMGLKFYIPSIKESYASLESTIEKKWWRKRMVSGVWRSVSTNVDYLRELPRLTDVSLSVNVSETLWGEARHFSDLSSLALSFPGWSLSKYLSSQLLRPLPPSLPFSISMTRTPRR